ncbi:CcmD family protein [Desertivirga xinjiangensis]|uniref:CcmD family protein n=1 Tax=Desertivirga xinjiangensis TaxID=539206 RepID=UPI00210E176E|nr:CcmD family protein [Pedobacter xinjiangensis]
MKRLFFSALSLFFMVMTSFAQTANEVEMADDMRSSGKIYVVVAVVAVILIGLLFYLFTMDRRLKKMENRH